MNETIDNVPNAQALSRIEGCPTTKSAGLDSVVPYRGSVPDEVQSKGASGAGARKDLEKGKREVREIRRPKARRQQMMDRNSRANPGSSSWKPT